MGQTKIVPPYFGFLPEKLKLTGQRLSFRGNCWLLKTGPLLYIFQKHMEQVPLDMAQLQLDN
jgi:hypothetical protein